MLKANLATKSMQAGVLRLSRTHLKSAIISKYSAEIPQRNPVSCTRMRYDDSQERRELEKAICCLEEVHTVRNTPGTDIRISVSNYKRPLMEFLSLSAVFCAIKPSCGRACTHI